MKDIIWESLADYLKVLNKPEDKINGFIDRMKRHMAISEASLIHNITRNVPIKHGSDTENHLLKIERASQQLKEALSFINKDEELRLRLLSEWQMLFPFDSRLPESKLFDSQVEVVRKINLVASNTFKVSKGKGKEFKVNHLRPEYKNNKVEHWKIEATILLRGALLEYFPDIQPKKNQSDKDRFYNILAILLEMENPKRIINSIVSEP